MTLQPRKDGAAGSPQAHSRPRIGVALTRDRFVRGEDEWFPLADTIWSAFTHVPVDDWKRYVSLRATQGFTALNISILPIVHDLSATDRVLPQPFDGFWDGAPRPGPLRRDYIEHARTMLDIAAANDLTPNLVVLWCNYVPETWASTKDRRYVISPESRRDYVASVVEAFDPYSPMYAVAGDADLVSVASREAWTDAQRQLRTLVPDAVTTIHKQDTAVLPDDLVYDAGLGYYSYQSGHRLECQHFAWQYAEHYLGAAVRRPIVNLEPCYEGHGFGFRYGRFDAAAVRRASWESLLAGASAGLGYGAHGIWQWHRRGAAFNHAEFSAMPFDRWTAAAFRGADDVAFAARFMREQRLVGAQPRQDLLRTPSDGVRAAVGDDPCRVAIYAPYASDVAVAPGVRILNVAAWDLETRQQGEAEVIDHTDGPILRQPEWNADTLYLLTIAVSP